MNQIQIITDAGSDIVDCSRTDLTVLPMTIRFGDEEYLDGVNLTHRQFYEKMIETQVLPTTSQPSPYAFETAIRKIHEQGDIALIITISSKLSGTWQSANIAAAETGGEVYIVDSLNVAVGEKAIVEYALRMKDAGTDIHTIVETLNHEKENLRVIALLDTLEYLQKGGRISKTVAIAGSLLSIKPVVAVVDGEVALLGKARGSRQGNNFLIQQIQKDGIDFSRPFFLGYTGLSDALLQKYISDSAEILERACRSSAHRNHWRRHRNPCRSRSHRSGVFYRKIIFELKGDPPPEKAKAPQPFSDRLRCFLSDNRIGSILLDMLQSLIDDRADMIRPPENRRRICLLFCFSPVYSVLKCEADGKSPTASSAVPAARSHTHTSASNKTNRIRILVESPNTLKSSARSYKFFFLWKLFIYDFKQFFMNLRCLHSCIRFPVLLFPA